MRLVAPNSKHPPEEGMRPLKVTAVMGEPIVTYGDGLHLDGPLSYGAYIEWVREHGYHSLPPQNGPWNEDFELPLARWRVQPHPEDQLHPNLVDSDGLIWGWCCSAAQVDWVAQGIHDVRKRPALGEFRRYTDHKTHDYGNGPMKARNLPMPTRLAFEVTWWCRGDQERVAVLLANVNALGKIVGHGMGKVLSWRVEPMELDWSTEREGLLVRRMPVMYRPSGAPCFAPIRAPYHHRSRTVIAVEP